MRVREGETAGMGAIFDRNHAELYGFFLRLTGSRAASEDLVQEVFLRILKYGRRFRAGERFRPWLYRIARNAAADHLRLAHREAGTPESVEEVADREWRAPERLQADAEARLLQRALERLSPSEREVLILARFQSLSHGEIAVILGCSPAAARVRLHRAIHALRDAYLALSGGNRHAMRRVE